MTELDAPRRSFAIISHPDAGKTTLTEKLLLYAGAIHLAGSVKGRRADRHATSDWMQMEQERGISVTSSVLQFAYGETVFNLLDTPGHADFSEDTLRTLAAVDAAIMLIDHAKGIEARTRKLFEVCRAEKLPVITFMNKLDREGRDPLGLLDEVAQTLQLAVAPHNWPVGMGRGFRGVVGVDGGELTLFRADEQGPGHGQTEARATQVAAGEVDAHLGAAAEPLHEQLSLLREAGDRFDPRRFVAGELSPVLWGSAMTNFGVAPLLDFIAAQAPPPRPRQLADGSQRHPENPRFSGLVFKIQANMNPKHRDRMAFMRVVSGRFRRGMTATLGRTGQAVRLAKPHMFVARERTLVEEAAAGDIVGLFDTGQLRIGDTLAEGERLAFAGIPRFAPEHFAQAQLADPLRRKALDRGLAELAQEGVVQLFTPREGPPQTPYLGAVGVLQFEVLAARLRDEYQVAMRLVPLPFRLARWVEGGAEALAWLAARADYPLADDRHGRPVVLAESAWALSYAASRAPNLVLHAVEPL